MRNLIAIVAMCLIGSFTFAADMVCSVVVNSNLNERVSKDLKFSRAFEEKFVVLQNSEFIVNIHASGGHFFGIEVQDKANGSILTTEGKDLTLASINGIQYAQRLKVLCIQP